MSLQLTLPLPPLNHPATLADFFWGENALLQQQLSLSLAHQGERFIYLWGESGCGKTHILQGACALTDKQQTAVYLPLEQLITYGPDCLEGLETQSLIAIDGIETIAAHPGWEEALFHFYNLVRDRSKAILLISGKTAPMTSSIRMADLRSRLSWGLVLQVKALPDDLKSTYLQQQALQRGFHLSEDAALFLIHRCARSLPALQQILDRLDDASLTAQRKITIPFIKAILNL